VGIGFLLMDVYLAPADTPSQALDRVTAAFIKYCPPKVHFVANEQAAQLVILPVVGRRDAILSKVLAIQKRRQRWAILQYVLRSTKTPHTNEWYQIWDGAEVVWSYLDLQSLALDDRTEDEFEGCVNFYHAPLGVEADVFRMALTKPTITVMTSGRDWLTESVRECVLAADAVGGSAVHLGAMLKGRAVACFSDVSDRALATLYAQCHYVSGLRRIEGFELPAAEGLLCGVRPILFEKRCYRDWYGTAGVYVEEVDRPGVIEQLMALFKKPVCPVTIEERNAAARRFHWPTILDSFWARCLA
jgi:hypothetical protein